MTTIRGLFQRAEGLISLLDADPEAASAELDRLAAIIAAEIDQTTGALLYRLSGPEPAKATPMQYGGFFLERDRDLLARAVKRGETWLLVEAGEGAYLDFVTDLPAHVFSWDAVATGFTLPMIRSLRSGRLCTNERGSDEDFARIEKLTEDDRVGV